MIRKISLVLLAVFVCLVTGCGKQTLMDIPISSATFEELHEMMVVDRSSTERQDIMDRMIAIASTSDQLQSMAFNFAPYFIKEASYLQRENFARKICDLATPKLIIYLSVQIRVLKPNTFMGDEVLKRSLERADLEDCTLILETVNCTAVSENAYSPWDKLIFEKAKSNCKEPGNWLNLYKGISRCMQGDPNARLFMNECLTKIKEASSPEDLLYIYANGWSTDDSLSSWAKEELLKLIHHK